jgi:ADP-ribose pyrophosphatase YjhB (NUDIX family)
MEQFLPAVVLKFCPFCGADAFVWDGEKSHRCGVCGKRLYVNSAAAVVALIENPRGELLLVRRRFDPAKGTLDLPGGFVDLEETAERAVVREVKEELNLDVAALTFWRTFPNRYLYGGIVYFTTDLVFRCAVNDFSTIAASDDTDDFVFLTKNKIDIDKVGLASIKEVLREYKTIVTH